MIYDETVESAAEAAQPSGRAHRIDQRYDYHEYS